MKLNLNRSKDYKYYGLLGLIILITLIIMVSISRDYLASPSIGTVSQSEQVASKKISLLSFEGKRFSFSYPNYFLPSDSSPANGSDIEKYSFVASQTATWNINIRVFSLSQPSLAYDPSYNFRKTNPQTYSEEVVTLGTNEAHIMTTGGGGYSRVVFLINGNIDASILLSSSSSLDSAKMDATLNQMIASWKWL